MGDALHHKLGPPGAKIESPAWSWALTTVPKAAAAATTAAVNNIFFKEQVVRKRGTEVR